MRSSEFLKELFHPGTSFNLEWDETFAPLEYHALAYDRQGRIINIGFIPFMGTEQSVVDVEFTRDGSHSITNQGDAERVIGTVLEAIRVYLTKYNRPHLVLFSGKGESRFKLYQRLVARFASRLGYQQIAFEQMPTELKEMPGMPKDVFALARVK